MGKGRDRSASSRLTNCMPSTPGLSWNVMQTLRRASTVGIYTYNQGGCAFGSLSRTPTTHLVRSFQSTNSKNKHENTAPQRSQSFQLLSHQIHKQLDSRPVTLYQPCTSQLPSPFSQQPRPPQHCPPTTKAPTPPPSPAAP